MWKKINGKWVVIKGDTGWRKIESSNLASGYVLVRRTSENAFITADGGKYNTVKIASNATVESDQMGESGQNRQRITLVKIPTGWGSKTTVAGQVVTHDGYDILGNAVVTAVNDQNGLQIRNYTGNKTQNQLLRFPMITYPTTVEWPTSLPGTAVDY